MKKLFIAALVFALGGTNILHAQNLPDQKETLNTLIKVNKHYMKNNPDCTLPSFVKGKMRPSNIWTRTVYYEGLLALYSIYPDTEYYAYAYQWGGVISGGCGEEQQPDMPTIMPADKYISTCTTSALNRKSC